MNNAVKNFNKFCIEYAKYRIEADNNESNNIRKLLEEGAHEFIGAGEESIIYELECPVKIAATFFKKIDPDTIKKAFENVDWRKYAESADLLVADKINVYLNSKCKFLNRCLDNGLAIQIAANIFITLDLPKKIFADYLNSCFPGIKHINPLEIDSIWETAKKYPKGIVCQSCFELANNPFSKSGLPEQRKGDEE